MPKLNAYQVAYARGMAAAARGSLQELSRYLAERGASKETVASVEVIASTLGLLQESIERERKE